MNVFCDPKDPLKMRFTRRKDPKRKEHVRESALPYKKRLSSRANVSSKPVGSPLGVNISNENGLSSTLITILTYQFCIEETVHKRAPGDYRSKWLFGLVRHLEQKILPTQSEKAKASLEMMKDGFVMHEYNHGVEFVDHVKMEFIKKVTGINGNSYDSLRMIFAMRVRTSIYEINKFLNEKTDVEWTGTRFEPITTELSLEEF